MLIVPILALSGHCAGPSEWKLASALVHSVCPSAASGLMVRPGGRVRMAVLISEGEEARLSNCWALRSTSRPEGEAGKSLLHTLRWADRWTKLQLSGRGPDRSEPRGSWSTAGRCRWSGC